METCRLCLYSGGEVKIIPIFDSQYGNLSGKIEECVSLKINEGDKITQICLKCVERLEQWEQFKMCCIRSNEILLKDEDCEKKARNVEKEKDPYSSDDIAHLMKPDIGNGTADSECEEETVGNNACSDELEGLLKGVFDDSQVKIGTNNVYTCEICNGNFGNCLDFLDHQETHDGDYVFKCSKCVEVFSSRNDLVQHENNHKSPCDYCGKLILKSSMRLHLNMHTDKYKCKECSKRFNSHSGLDQHRITVHTDIKDHICEHCGKSFSTLTSMRVHMKTHSEERKYRCKQCAYAGRTASALYIHMSTHSDDVRICELCSKTFKSMRNLNDHLRRFHSKVKKYDCNHCGKKFVEKYLLTVHLRAHTGVRPYKCGKCEKSFVRSDGLKEHLETHERVALECMECGKSFNSKRGFSRHICTGVL